MFFMLVLLFKHLMSLLEVSGASVNEQKPV